MLCPFCDFWRLIVCLRFEAKAPCGCWRCQGGFEVKVEDRVQSSVFGSECIDEKQ